MKSHLLLNREREGAAAASTNPEVPIAHTSKIDIWRPCRPKRALRLWASRTYDAPEMLSAAIAVPLASSDWIFHGAVAGLQRIIGGAYPAPEQLA